MNEHDVLRPLAAGGPHPETSDALRGVWWVVWQGPLAGEFSVLLARADRDRIVLEGQWTIADDGREFRWAFSEITADSFRWQAHISEDGGKTWRLVEEIQARRRTGRPA